jgi:hypothetical protein
VPAGAEKQQCRPANGAAALTREQHADIFGDVVVEGPREWAVRPVGEFFHERDFGQFQTRSALAGAIWQVKDNLAIDFGLRGARVNITRRARSAPG